MNKKWTISLIGGILVVLVGVLVLVGQNGCNLQQLVTKETETKTNFSSISADQTKYLFLVVKERNLDSITGIKVSMRPLTIYSFDKVSKRLTLLKDYERMVGEAVVILGHTIDFDGQGREGTTQNLFLFNSIPAIASLSNPVKLGSLKAIRIIDDLRIEQIDDLGQVSLQYGSKRIILKPGDIWKDTESESINSIQYTTEVEIANYGLMEKNSLEYR